MDKLNGYWLKYDSGTATDTGDCSGTGTITINGYACPNCGRWVSSGEYHYCTWPSTWISGYVYPIPNKTEQAFKILKALVESKIIREPTSFKKFCDLIEKIAGII